jgi:hypothetical protein
VKLLYYWKIYGPDACPNDVFELWEDTGSTSSCELPFKWCFRHHTDLIRRHVDADAEFRQIHTLPTLREALECQLKCERVRVKRIIVRNEDFWYGFTENDDYFCQGKRQIGLMDLTFSRHYQDDNRTGPPPPPGSFIYYLGDKRYYTPEPNDYLAELVEFVFADKLPKLPCNSFVRVMTTPSELEKHSDVFIFFKTHCM